MTEERKDIETRFSVLMGKTYLKQIEKEKETKKVWCKRKTELDNCKADKEQRHHLFCALKDNT